MSEKESIEQKLRQKAEENLSKNKEIEDLTKKLHELQNNLDDVKSQVTIAYCSAENDIAAEKRKCNDEVASVEQICKEKLDALEGHLKSVDQERNHYKELYRKIVEDSDCKKENVLSLPPNVLGAVTKSFAKRVPSLSSLQGLQNQETPNMNISSQTSVNNSPRIHHPSVNNSPRAQPEPSSPTTSLNLEENMKRAQEDAEVLRSLVEPLEEEIKALKDKIRDQDTQLRMFESQQKMQLTSEVIAPLIQGKSTEECVQKLDEKLQDVKSNLEAEKDSRADLELYCAILNTQKTVLANTVDNLKQQVSELRQMYERERKEKLELRKTWQLANDEFLETQRIYLADMRRVRFLLTQEQLKKFNELQQLDPKEDDINSSNNGIIGFDFKPKIPESNEISSIIRLAETLPKSNSVQFSPVLKRSDSHPESFSPTSNSIQFSPILKESESHFESFSPKSNSAQLSPILNKILAEKKEKSLSQQSLLLSASESHELEEEEEKSSSNMTASSSLLDISEDASTDPRICDLRTLKINLESVPNLVNSVKFESLSKDSKTSEFKPESLFTGCKAIEKPESLSMDSKTIEFIPESLSTSKILEFIPESLSTSKIMEFIPESLSTSKIMEFIPESLSTASNTIELNLDSACIGPKMFQNTESVSLMFESQQLFPTSNPIDLRNLEIENNSLETVASSSEVSSLESSRNKYVEDSILSPILFSNITNKNTSSNFNTNSPEVNSRNQKIDRINLELDLNNPELETRNTEIDPRNQDSAINSRKLDTSERVCSNRLIEISDTNLVSAKYSPEKMRQLTDDQKKALSEKYRENKDHLHSMPDPNTSTQQQSSNVEQNERNDATSLHRIVSETEWQKLLKEIKISRLYISQSCQHCNNYEIELKKYQIDLKTLEKERLKFEKANARLIEALDREALYRKKIENQWKEKAESFDIKNKEVEATVDKVTQKYNESINSSRLKMSKIEDKIKLFLKDRNSVQAELSRLQAENDNLVGKHSQHSQDMQNEIINLPDSMEEMQLLLLKYREELIASKVAKEVTMEKREKELEHYKELLSKEQSFRKNLEQSLKQENTNLRKELTSLEQRQNTLENENQEKQEWQGKMKQNEQKQKQNSLENEEKISALKSLVQEQRQHKLDYEKNISELQRKISTLQNDLKVSEDVQRDFVRLSQSLQVELEKIRQSEKEVRWQHEDDVEACNECKQKFNVVGRRKHHCKHCGKIFCSDCVTKTVPSGSNRRPTRVCDVCHTLLVQDATPFFSKCHK